MRATTRTTRSASLASFASADALRDYLGRYGEAGVRRFIFFFGNEPARGIVATRETLEAFAAETLTGR